MSISSHFGTTEETGKVTFAFEITINDVTGGISFTNFKDYRSTRNRKVEPSGKDAAAVSERVRACVCTLTRIHGDNKASSRAARLLLILLFSPSRSARHRSRCRSRCRSRWVRGAADTRGHRVVSDCGRLH